MLLFQIFREPLHFFQRRAIHVGIHIFADESGASKGAQVVWEGATGICKEIARRSGQLSFSGFRRILERFDKRSGALLYVVLNCFRRQVRFPTAGLSQKNVGWENSSGLSATGSGAGFAVSASERVEMFPDFTLRSPIAVKRIIHA